MALKFSRRAFMSRGFGVLAVSAFPFLRNSANAVASERSDVPTFYISALGSDKADGHTPDTAWATVQHAADSLPSGGSRVLLRRGDTFYGEFTPPFGCEMGAYGSGDRPILTMFKILNRADGWVEHSPGTWKIDLGSTSTHDGYTKTSESNIGFLMVDGVVRPALQLDVSMLKDPWDFYSDIPHNILYVAAPENPANLATDIRAAPNSDIMDGSGAVIQCSNGANEIHDIHITGTGGCGITGTGSDVHIHDCLIDFIGGSLLIGETRYGNGISNWVNAKRWLIEKNEIAQVYDTAWSAQGTAGSDGGWEDMTFRANHVHDCTQSIEFWSMGSASALGFRRILVEGNLCERAGYSAFSDVRPDQKVRVQFLTYFWETPADIVIQNNTFDQAYGAYAYNLTEPIGCVSRNNTIRMRPGQLIEFQRSETADQFGAWQAATRREVGSVMIVSDK